MSALRNDPAVEERRDDAAPPLPPAERIGEPEGAPAVAAPPEEHSRRAASYVLVVAALAAAAVGGWLTGGALDRRPAPPPRPHVIATGNVQLAVDGGWRAMAAPRALTGLGLRDLRTFGALVGAPATAWTAHAPLGGPTLLPARLRAAVAPPLPHPRLVSLAGRPAWAYRGLSLAGGTALDVIVAPTAHESLLVGCSAPFAWWSAAAGCERGVRDVSAPPPVRPSSVLAARHALPGVVRALSRTRRTQARALARARHPRRQARAAGRIAAAERTAARGLAPLLPAKHRAPVRALRHSAAAYAAIASAARHHDERRYRRVRTRARHADAVLRRSLHRLAG
jgi:hypothetical protein